MYRKNIWGLMYLPDISPSRPGDGQHSLQQHSGGLGGASSVCVAVLSDESMVIIDLLNCLSDMVKYDSSWLNPIPECGHDENGVLDVSRLVHVYIYI